MIHMIIGWFWAFLDHWETFSSFLVHVKFRGFLISWWREPIISLRSLRIVSFDLFLHSLLQKPDLSLIFSVLIIVASLILIWLPLILPLRRDIDGLPPFTNLFHDIQSLHVWVFLCDLLSCLSNKNHIGREALLRLLDFFIIYSVVMLQLLDELQLLSVSFFVYKNVRETNVYLDQQSACTRTSQLREARSTFDRFPSWSVAF